MSMTLDDRARAASAGVRRTVAEADLRLLETGPTRRSGVDPTPAGRWALAGATVAVVVVVGLFAGPSLLVAPAGPGVTAPQEAMDTTPLPPSTTSTPSVAVPVAPSTTMAPPTTIADGVAPILEITDPVDGSVVEEQLVTFRGVTEPGARVFAGRYEADVASDGRWELALVLAPGTNTARFTATDAAGNVAEASVSVVYQAPATTTTTKPATTTTTKAPEAKSAAFTAVSIYGSCAETPPYDDYEGTGEPGTTVWVGSAYGSATTQVHADGTWKVRVVFEGAPVGEAFEVKAKDELGRKVLLQFTALSG
ncbi:MAG: hypothetical protein R6X29_12190 [Acidimicrobiia bacterium]|jgi:hypothetical protein